MTNVTVKTYHVLVHAVIVVTDGRRLIHGHVNGAGCLAGHCWTRVAVVVLKCADLLYVETSCV